VLGRAFNQAPASLVSSVFALIGDGGDCKISRLWRSKTGKSNIRCSQKIAHTASPYELQIHFVRKSEDYPNYYGILLNNYQV